VAVGAQRQISRRALYDSLSDPILALCDPHRLLQQSRPRADPALYGLNPMAGVVEGFRWVLLGKAGGPGPLVIVSALTVTVLLAGGLVYFRRMEKTFAHIV
jgi:ABC-type polysaccharide/polyol phosphate export permease